MVLMCSLNNINQVYASTEFSQLDDEFIGPSDFIGPRSLQICPDVVTPNLDPWMTVHIPGNILISVDTGDHGIYLADYVTWDIDPSCGDFIDIDKVETKNTYDPSMGIPEDTYTTLNTEWTYTIADHLMVIPTQEKDGGMKTIKVWANLRSQNLIKGSYEILAIVEDYTIESLERNIQKDVSLTEDYNEYVKSVYTQWPTITYPNGTQEGLQCSCPVDDAGLADDVWLLDTGSEYKKDPSESFSNLINENKGKYQLFVYSYGSSFVWQVNKAMDLPDLYMRFKCTPDDVSHYCYHVDRSLALAVIDPTANTTKPECDPFIEMDPNQQPIDGIYKWKSGQIRIPPDVYLAGVSFCEVSLVGGFEGFWSGSGGNQIFPPYLSFDDATKDIIVNTNYKIHDSDTNIKIRGEAKYGQYDMSGEGGNNELDIQFFISICGDGDRVYSLTSNEQATTYNINEGLKAHDLSWVLDAFKTHNLGNTRCFEYEFMESDKKTLIAHPGNNYISWGEGDSSLHRSGFLYFNTDGAEYKYVFWIRARTPYYTSYQYAKIAFIRIDLGVNGDGQGGTCDTGGGQGVNLWGKTGNHEAVANYEIHLGLCQFNSANTYQYLQMYRYMGYGPGTGGLCSPNWISIIQNGQYAPDENQLTKSFQGEVAYRYTGNAYFVRTSYETHNQVSIYATQAGKYQFSMIVSPFENYLNGIYKEQIFTVYVCGDETIEAKNMQPHNLTFINPEKDKKYYYSAAYIDDMFTITYPSGFDEKCKVRDINLYSDAAYSTDYPRRNDILKVQRSSSYTSAIQQKNAQRLQLQLLEPFNHAIYVRYKTFGCSYAYKLWNINVCGSEVPRLSPTGLQNKVVYVPSQGVQTDFVGENMYLRIYMSEFHHYFEEQFECPLKYYIASTAAGDAMTVASGLHYVSIQVDNSAEYNDYSNSAYYIEFDCREFNMLTQGYFYFWLIARSGDWTQSPWESKGITLDLTYFHEWIRYLWDEEQARLAEIQAAADAEEAERQAKIQGNIDAWQDQMEREFVQDENNMRPIFDFRNFPNLALTGYSKTNKFTRTGRVYKTFRTPTIIDNEGDDITIMFNGLDKLYPHVQAEVVPSQNADEASRGGKQIEFTVDNEAITKDMVGEYEFQAIMYDSGSNRQVTHNFPVDIEFEADDGTIIRDLEKYERDQREMERLKKQLEDERIQAELDRLANDEELDDLDGDQDLDGGPYDIDFGGGGIKPDYIPYDGLTEKRPFPSNWEPNPIEVEVTDITRDGIVQLGFNQELLVPDIEQIDINDIFDIRIDQHNEDYDIGDYSFELAQWGDGTIEIFMIFDNPLRISYLKEDKIDIKIKRPDLFKSPYDFSIPVKTKEIQGELPRQLLLATQDKDVQYIADQSSGAMIFLLGVGGAALLFIGGNFFTFSNLVLWLQLVMSIPIYDKAMPPLVDMFLERVRGIINFHWFQTDRVLYGEKNMDRFPYSKYDQDMIGNTINQYLIALIFMFVCIGFILLIFWLSSFCCKLCNVNINCCCMKGGVKAGGQCAQQSYEQLQIVYEGIIGNLVFFAIYTYLNLNIYAMTNFKRSWEKDELGFDKYREFSYWFFYMLLLPFLMFYTLYMSRAFDLEDAKGTQRLSTLQDQIALYRSIYGKYYWPLALLRRNVYVLVPAMFFDQHAYQISIALVSQTCFILVLGVSMQLPFKSSTFRFYCYLNEFVLFCLFMHLMLFTDFVCDIQMQYYIGYSFIAFITSVVLGNFCMTLRRPFFLATLKCCHCCCVACRRRDSQVPLITRKPYVAPLYILKKRKIKKVKVIRYIDEDEGAYAKLNSTTNMGTTPRQYGGTPNKMIINDNGQNNEDLVRRANQQKGPQVKGSRIGFAKSNDNKRIERDQAGNVQLKDKNNQSAGLGPNGQRYGTDFQKYGNKKVFEADAGSAREPGGKSLKKDKGKEGLKHTHTGVNAHDCGHLHGHECDKNHVHAKPQSHKHKHKHKKPHHKHSHKHLGHVNGHPHMHRALTMAHNPLKRGHTHLHKHSPSSNSLLTDNSLLKSGNDVQNKVASTPPVMKNIKDAMVKNIFNRMVNSKQPDLKSAQEFQKMGAAALARLDGDKRVHTEEMKVHKDEKRSKSDKKKRKPARHETHNNIKGGKVDIIVEEMFENKDEKKKSKKNRKHDSQNNISTGYQMFENGKDKSFENEIDEKNYVEIFNGKKLLKSKNEKINEPLKLQQEHSQTSNQDSKTPGFQKTSTITGHNFQKFNGIEETNAEDEVSPTKNKTHKMNFQRQEGDTKLIIEGDTQNITNTDFSKELESQNINNKINEDDEKVFGTAEQEIKEKLVRTIAQSFQKNGPKQMKTEVEVGDMSPEKKDKLNSMAQIMGKAMVADVEKKKVVIEEEKMEPELIPKVKKGKTIVGKQEMKFKPDEKKVNVEVEENMEPMVMEAQIKKGKTIVGKSDFKVKPDEKKVNVEVEEMMEPMVPQIKKGKTIVGKQEMKFKPDEKKVNVEVEENMEKIEPMVPKVKKGMTIVGKQEMKFKPDEKKVQVEVEENMAPVEPVKLNAVKKAMTIVGKQQMVVKALDKKVEVIEESNMPEGSPDEKNNTAQALKLKGREDAILLAMKKKMVTVVQQNNPKITQGDKKMTTVVEECSEPISPEKTKKLEPLKKEFKKMVTVQKTIATKVAKGNSTKNLVEETESFSAPIKKMSTQASRAGKLSSGNLGGFKPKNGLTAPEPIRESEEDSLVTDSNMRDSVLPTEAPLLDVEEQPEESSEEEVIVPKKLSKAVKTKTKIEKKEIKQLVTKDVYEKFQNGEITAQELEQYGESAKDKDVSLFANPPKDLEEEYDNEQALKTEPVEALRTEPMESLNTEPVEEKKEEMNTSQARFKAIQDFQNQANPFAQTQSKLLGFNKSNTQMNFNGGANADDEAMSDAQDMNAQGVDNSSQGDSTEENGGRKMFFQGNFGSSNNVRADTDMSDQRKISEPIQEENADELVNDHMSDLLEKDEDEEACIEEPVQKQESDDEALDFNKPVKAPEQVEEFEDLEDWKESDNYGSEDEAEEDDQGKKLKKDSSDGIDQLF